VLGCVALLVIGMKPPNEKAAWIVGGALLLLALVWFGGAKDRFGRSARSAPAQLFLIAQARGAA
jgi:hypothetical protein